MGAHLGASRLLYGMGRDDAIPRGFFGAVNPRTHVPSNNVILVGVLALGGAFTVSYGLGAELLNFGAFIAFMGVNLSALVHYWWRGERKTVVDLVPPLLGFLICAYLWWSLSWPARIAGFVWLLTGIAYGAWKTKGFKKPIEFRRTASEGIRGLPEIRPGRRPGSILSRFVVGIPDPSRAILFVGIPERR